MIQRAGEPVVWRWLSLAMALVVLGGFAAGLGPLALKSLVDGLARRVDGSTTAAAGALYIGALVAQRLCEQAQTYAYGLGEQRMVRRLSGQAFAHLLRLPLDFLLDARSGAVAQTLAQGVMGLRIICTHLVLTLTPVLIQLAVAVWVLTQAFGSAAALLFLVAVIAYGLVFAWSALRMDGSLRGLTAAQIETGALTSDAMMNAEAIKAFTAEDRFSRRYDVALAATEAHWRTYLGRRLESGFLVALVFGVMIAAAVALAARRVESGTFSLGGFVLVTTYLLQVVRPLELAGFAARDIGQGAAYLEALLAALRQAPEPSGVAGQNTPPPGPARLTFENVSFAFRPGRPILRNVTFEAAPGSLVAVVGPSGAGKSSLLRLVLRFYDPTHGRVLLDGVALATWPLAILRGQLALVSQDTILLNDTIAENIGLAVDAPAEAAVLRAASVACLSDLLRASPEGLQTRVGERGLKLSGGEKQRVAIARAVLRQARLVICDEATAALDSETEQAVIDALSNIARTATILIVTHRLASVTHADQILVFEQGEIVERGRHEDLLARDGLYARLWRTQVGLATSVSADQS